MTDTNDTDTDDVAITIEGRGPTIVDALADVLVNTQTRLRAINSAPDATGDGDHQ